MDHALAVLLEKGNKSVALLLVRPGGAVGWWGQRRRRRRNLQLLLRSSRRWLERPPRAKGGEPLGRTPQIVLKNGGCLLVLCRCVLRLLHTRLPPLLPPRPRKNTPSGHRVMLRGSATAAATSAAAAAAGPVAGGRNIQRARPAPRVGTGDRHPLASQKADGRTIWRMRRPRRWRAGRASATITSSGGGFRRHRNALVKARLQKGGEATVVAAAGVRMIVGDPCRSRSDTFTMRIHHHPGGYRTQPLVFPPAPRQRPASTPPALRPPHAPLCR